MRYREYAPTPAAACAVACVWTLDGDPIGPGEAAQPVLPDGRPEIVLHIGDSFERRGADGAWTRQPARLFAGQLTEALSLRPCGRTAVIGIRLHPHGAAALMRVPQRELAGATVDLAALDRTLAGLLADAAGGTVDEAVAHVQRGLTRMVDAARLDARVQFAVRAIERTHGTVTPGRLAHIVNLTPRQLERLFAASVGLSPKQLAGIVRFHHALALLERQTAARGADVAAACGYADQAHFVRDFRRIAGYTPGAHLLHRAELTGVFAAQDRIDPPRAASRA